MELLESIIDRDYNLEEETDRRLVKNLYNQIIFGEWKIVVESYRNNYNLFRNQTLNKLGETALHLAVSHGPENIVEDLVQIISQQGSIQVKEVLRITNNNGDNPLHLAAASGSLRKCICIAEAHRSLGNERNRMGESPLFLAALHGKTDIFLCLHHICKQHLDDSYYRRNGGETILHCAIKRECWDLAYQILLKHKTLVTSVDEHGILPLNLIADKPAAFRSGCHLGWWNEIMYHCIPVDDVFKSIDPEQMIKRCKGKQSPRFPENYKTCVNFYRLLEKMARDVITKGKALNKGSKADVEDGSNATPDKSKDPKHQGSDELKKIKEKHVLSLGVLKRTIQALPIHYYLENGQNPERIPFLKESTVDMDIGSSIKEDIEKNELKKKKETSILAAPRNGITEMVEEKLNKFPMAIHDDTDEGKNIALLVVENRQPQIHQLLLKRELLTETMLQKLDKDGNNALHLAAKLWISSSSKEDEHKKKETSILAAARNGITEMVEEILNKFPMAIHDDTDEGKNIALLAVENRQPKIYQLLLKRELLTETMLQKVDKDGNNALHLAAKLGKNKPWLIPGAALQVQWEIKWYEYVKRTVPQYLLFQPNNDKKIPAQLFTEHHEKLVQEGGEWLSKTSESCSVVAALIATVAFATSTAIPGGIKESSGSPNLETYPAFDVFAVTSLVALCFSVTALFLFLAILTSRYQEKDFRSDLPRKLLLGLTSLFVSIASMLVSFCAGHFFVLKDKLKNKALPVYAVTCLPITFYAIAQFPLYFDLVRTYFRKVPRSSHKVVSL
ncbi:hypothetical protein ACB098_03G166200 [Castanea mollissima]